MSAYRRNIEFWGLFLVGITLIAGIVIARAAKQQVFSVPPASLVNILVVLFVGHILLRYKARQTDPLLLPICAFLAAVGIIELWALRSPYASSQQIWFQIGIVLTISTVIFIRRPDEFRAYKYLAGTIGIVLLLSPIFFGTVRGGSKLWLVAGGYSFQPSEIAKIFLIIFLAAYLAEKKEVLAAGRRGFLGLSWPSIRYFGPLVLTWVISLAILVLERDLGSSLIFFSLFLVLLYIATGRVAYVIVGISLFMGGATAAYHLFSHVATRVNVWLEPLPSDVGGSAYQVAQSLFSMAGGALSGTGLGAGFLGRQISMPAVHTDFIFSALSEEIGLAGSVVIVLVYVFFVARGLKISLEAKNDFTKLFAAGLTVVVGIQAFVIIGGIIKLIPMTGVTLPFVSYGGSSLVSNFLMVGLLMAIARQNHEH